MQAQVQTKVMYRRLQITLDGVQLSTCSNYSSLSPQGTTVLSPCCCTAHLDMLCTSGDVLLPQLKALVELDHVHLQLTPSSVAILNQSLLQSSASANAERQSAEAEQKVRLPQTSM